MFDKLYFRWKRFKKSVIELYHDQRGDMPSNFPQKEIEAFARYLLPKIQNFFASEEGQAQFQKWKEQQRRPPANPTA